jgi:hypothetical protein
MLIDHGERELVEREGRESAKKTGKPSLISVIIVGFLALLAARLLTAFVLVLP